MRKDKIKLQRGDVLFEASGVRKEVTAWLIIDIYLKDGVSPETVVVVWSSMFGYVEFSPSEVCCWHDSLAEAEEYLGEMLA